MSDVLIRSTDGVTLIGGGDVDRAALSLALELAPRLVAADGGADIALEHGHRPTAVVGDFDSIANLEYWQNSDVYMCRLDEQDTTDFEKCLRSVAAPFVLGVGFLGPRLDHALAAMSAVIAYGARPIVLLGGDQLVFHCPTSIELPLVEGTVVSLFPMAPVRGVGSTGLQWPITGLDMAPGARVGTSNRAATSRVSMAFDRPGMLVILPLSALDAVVATLSTRGR